MDTININNSFPPLAVQQHQLGPLKHHTRWPTAPLRLDCLASGPSGSRGRLEGLEMGTSEKKKRRGGGGNDGEIRLEALGTEERETDVFLGGVLVGRESEK
ncbi:hypothetical protein FCV25MIE_30254 [Fagus crenata]